MFQGKATCETLKSVRKKIADANGIDYHPTECNHQGECSGTCQRCESEARYIENQLSLRQAAGKAIKIIGLATGVSALCAELPACVPIAGDEPELPKEYIFVNNTNHDIVIQSTTDTIRVGKGKSYRCEDAYLRRNIECLDSVQVVYDDTVAIRYSAKKSVEAEGKELNFLRKDFNCNDDYCCLLYTFTDADYQYALAHKDDVEEEVKQQLIRPIPTDSTASEKKED